MKNKWNSFKNWISNTFGADISLSNTTTFENKVIASLAPLSIRTGVKNINSVSGPNSSKLVCSYWNFEVSNKFNSSTVGVKCNINKVKLDLSLGLYNIGLSHSYVEDDTACGYSIRLNQGQCGVEIEGYTIKWDKTSNLSQKTYTILDINLLTIFLMHAVANSIQGANNYQPAPSYGYLEI